MKEPYPKNITLVKLSTLSDAEQPQPEKYPNGTERKGLMWEFNKPKIGDSFMVLISKICPIFITSDVTKIMSETDDKITFKTRNSTYEIQITS